MRRSQSECGRSLLGTIVGVLIAWVVVVGVFYYFNKKGEAVSAAWHSIRTTSEDAATTTKVRTALMLSKHVSAFDIKVSAKQGEVTLNGQVPSEDIKAMAGVIAQDTSGVKQLNNFLVVDPATRPNPETSRLGERVADLEVKTVIQDALLKSTELKDQRIEVSVKQHTVTLNGVAENGTQKTLAQQIAWGIDGVQGVLNNIAVTHSQNQESPDDKLSKRVEFELYSVKAFSLNALQIHSQDGAVTLTGTVASRAERLLAERVAQGVDGVKKVVNNLNVADDNRKEV